MKSLSSFVVLTSLHGGKRNPLWGKKGFLSNNSINVQHIFLVTKKKVYFTDKKCRLSMKLTTTSEYIPLRGLQLIA